ncbi:CHAT domain-containing protein [Nostoc sp. TCL26-01]|uniref:CHAT domain-containing protein n=1 Tax=Nostoc sp. TCL26-01 TaxID=2576904 RepID=UPI0015C01E1A|nr:CHAT domain-containing protein [Nostoc sp. TCL26-01]QLE54977.1 CHAT domain-containing protein [Nostoc sp. TCL26-01]
MRRALRLVVLVIFGLSFSLGMSILFPVVAQNYPSPIQQTSALTLVQSGKQYYDAGQFAVATQLLQQAAQVYQTSGDIAHQAQTLSLLSLVEQKLGHWQKAKTAIDASLNLLAKLPSDKKLSRIHAQVLNSLGHWQLAQGQTESALVSWEKAEKLYIQSQDTLGVVGSQINRALALQTLGLYRRAEKLLVQVEQQLYQQPDSPLKVNGLLNLGNLRRFNGDLEKSREILTQSLTITQRLRLPEAESTALLNLGNTELAIAHQAEELKDTQRTEEYKQQALERYQKANAIATLPTTKIQAQLNYFAVLIETKQFTLTSPIIAQITADLNQLPTSRVSIYARVNFAKSLLKMAKTSEHPQIIQILATAIEQARNLADQQAESYTLGTLGAVYEQAGDWSNAKKHTQSALVLAQAINAPDISYQWQWQMGRLLRAENTPTQAITYYTEAFKNLSNLRSDLVALNPEVQFSFRASTEPVYRQLVDLLLSSPQTSRDNLIQARQVMEALQLAELDNFFGDACVQPKQVNIDQLDPNAAVIYPIILANRLEVIVKLPGSDNLRHYAHTNISETQIDAAVTQLQKSLKRPSTSLKQLKTQSQQIYDWLIKPFADELETAKTREQSQIKTLVFVLDGSLRNLPMSILHDGQKYLIERYAVSVTPTLQLLEAKPLQTEVLRVLIAGATDAPSFKKEGLGTIDNVAVELEGIKENIQRHQILENQAFIKKNVQANINQKPFNILHLATHGKFSSNPEQTYILDWNGRINVKDLDNLLRLNYQRSTNPIELLILSACETASGDKRAALGLAGVAIRAGARTTLASLWQINDASTAEFMIKFYQELNRGKITKSEALRNTQLSFLQSSTNRDYNRPYHWSAFILVGNWL